MKDLINLGLKVGRPTFQKMLVKVITDILTVPEKTRLDA